MKIAVASGKGGTGKTTLSTNLAYEEAKRGRRVTYADCDVEEPNGHLFLKPVIDSSNSVGLMVPNVNQDLCSHCGQCGEICAYSAIVCIGDKVLTFPDMCHSCAGCWLVCPEQAISQTMREMGRVEIGHSNNIQFVQGILNVGEAMSPPVIRSVKQSIPESDIIILDAPPGASCPVIETLKGSDYVILITEPTPFGLNDLVIAVDMVRKLNYPFGVVINRADLGNNAVRQYCQRQDITLLAEIPDNRRIAEFYSKGTLISEAIPEYAIVFQQIMDRISREIENAGVLSS